jgi:hypothetical protein
MAKRHELQLERHAASEGIAELREEEIDNRVHAGDAIQTRPERPGILRRMRLLGGTGDSRGFADHAVRPSGTYERAEKISF